MSTRKGNRAGLSALIGKSPVGDWELALPNTAETRGWFASGAIRDLLFVITCNGRVPDWPADS